MDKKEIFITAWQIVKNYGYTISDALKIAWRNAKFKSVAKTKIVEFFFKKVDGSMRQAYGTLKESLIPETKGDERKKSDLLQPYFDTEKKAWRCFKKCNLIKII